MNEFIKESYQLDINILESSNTFINEVTELQIKTSSNRISDSVYMEGTVESITKFFQDVIQKIKEFAEKIEQKIRDKMLEMKFQQTCKQLKQSYYADKTKYEGKKVTVFDQVKYRKRAHDLIREYYKVLTELSNREWKSESELERYIDKLVNKVEIQDKDCYVEREVKLFIDTADEYMKSILKEKKSCEADIIDLIRKSQDLMDKKKRKVTKTTPVKDSQKSGFFLFRFIRKIMSIFTSISSKIMKGFGDGAWKVVTVAAGLAVLTAV